MTQRSAKPPCIYCGQPQEGPVRGIGWYCVNEACKPPPLVEPRTAKQLLDLLERAHYWVQDAAVNGHFTNAAVLLPEIEAALKQPADETPAPTAKTHLTRISAYGRVLEDTEPDSLWFYCLRSEVTADEIERLEREVVAARELLRKCVTTGYSRHEINCFLAGQAPAETTAEWCEQCNGWKNRAHMFPQCKCGRKRR